MSDEAVIEPGAMLGVLGGGQLGRMFVQAAAALGYRVMVYAPETDCPAAQVADHHVCAEYDNSSALDRFATDCEAITIEFENIPPSALERIHRVRPVRPGPDVLRITQDRLVERVFLDRIGVPTAPHMAVHRLSDVKKAAQILTTPFVIKNATQGYDGRGQARVDHPDDAVVSWKALGGRPALCEAWVDYECELSVLVARSARGEARTFGPIENRHLNHVLDLSFCPAEVGPSFAENARILALKIAEAMQLQGLICVEMFLTRNGDLLVNELAPRPHNSGHLTIEAAEVSQFEQQVRILCNLPLSDMKLRKPAAMANLLGVHCCATESEIHSTIHDYPIRLHLYGKEIPMPSRKMGHITCLAESTELAVQHVLAARQAISNCGLVSPESTKQLV